MSHKNKFLLHLLIFIYVVVTGCSQSNSSATPIFVVTDNSLLTVTLSPVSTITQTTTAIPTDTSETIAHCKITNKNGQLYLLSDQQFRDLRTTAGKLDQALVVHYPEWQNYTTQVIPWSTQPIKLGEIIVSVSHDEESNIQLNPAVTLVTLGESLNWHFPSNSDFYLEAQEISIELNRLSLDWDNPYNESLRSQYMQIANAGSYALYVFFDYDLKKLEAWVQEYDKMFGDIQPRIITEGC